MEGFRLPPPSLVSALLTQGMITVVYEQRLADRVRRILRHEPDIAETEMFGGLAIMHRGRMVLGIVKDELMVRVGPENYSEALRHPHTRPMDFTGRPLRGFVFVASKGLGENDNLKAWIALGLSGVKPPPRLSRSKNR